MTNTQFSALYFARMSDQPESVIQALIYENIQFRFNKQMEINDIHSITHAKIIHPKPLLNYYLTSIRWR